MTLYQRIIKFYTREYAQVSLLWEGSFTTSDTIKIRFTEAKHRLCIVILITIIKFTQKKEKKRKEKGF